MKTFHTTNERYDYIFGNTARKLEIPESPRRNTKKGKKAGGSGKRAVTQRTIERRAMEKARREEEEKARHKAWFLEFDWKYTVVVIMALTICSLACLFYVSKVARVNRMQQDLYDLKARNMALSGKQTALKAEVDKAVNLEQIEEYAEKHLKMKFPEKGSIIRYRINTNDYFRKYIN